MATPAGKYSCGNAAETFQWMNAIADFLRPFRPLLDSHVVNFFKARLWELVDEEWMECLRKEPVENLLNIPSGFVRDYWPSSLQDFILTLRSLSFPREQKFPDSITPNMRVAALGTVLSQGMNLKKKHEVEVLAALVHAIALDVDARSVIDVGSGQGYLAQVLSFEYRLSVIAIDASLHHSTVTSARAERIKKHYASKLRKSQYGNVHLKVPNAVICNVLSSDALLTAIGTSFGENIEQIGSLESSKSDMRNPSVSCHNLETGSAFVLAGLHACGDLSVNMLRTFLDCRQAKAVVGIGCCYNLLSEECSEVNSTCGFPMSSAAKLSLFNLGKNARDLACQSAERWKSLTKATALQNFELHSFRAAFQMVLDKYYPEVLISSPSIGRQGKTLRRQQCKRVIESRLGAERGHFPPSKSKEDCITEDGSRTSSETVPLSRDNSSMRGKEYQSLEIHKKYKLFKEFSESGLDRLNLSPAKDIDFLEIWKEPQLFSELVGPYWSLRAALGQLVETYILLDRLLFIQEQGNFVEAFLFPIFDPTVSPRNVAIIARKNG